MTRRPPAHAVRLTAAALLMLAAALLAGCNVVGFMSQVIGGGRKTPAQHRLAPERTLVMVDDPRGLLGRPLLASVVATHLRHTLEQSETFEQPDEPAASGAKAPAEPGATDTAPPAGSFVPDADLVELSARLGEEFATTPIDQVGRLLDAGQVIYVRIAAVQMEVEPGFYRPEATAEVRVIDADSGRRLFPNPRLYADPGQPPPGATVRSDLPPLTAPPEDRGIEPVLRRKLAEKLGQQAARLFYDAPKPQPGDRL